MVDTVPCFSRCRGASSYSGHYLLKRQRLMTDIEIARLQGIPDNHYQKAAMALGLRKYRAAIGNAMSANVLARVLAYALPAAGLDCRDNAAPTAEFTEHILAS
jgi:site-specific DNA-cytosine methylase